MRDTVQLLVICGAALFLGLLRLSDSIAAAPGSSKTDFPILAAPEVEALRQEGEARILDARPGAFYELGHVPGALNLSRMDFDKDWTRLEATLGKEKERPVVVYCSEPSCTDSRWVAEQLRQRGFAKISLFEGGWEAWEAAGLPVESAENAK